MNVRLGARLPDGRRADLQWRWRRAPYGTIIQATVRHDGDISPEDVLYCLREVVEDEALMRSAGSPRRRRRRCGTGRSSA